MAAQHPLLAVPCKRTIFVSFKASGVLYAKRELPEEVEAVTNCAQELDSLRTTIVEICGEQEKLPPADFEAKLWLYYEKLRNYSKHIPSGEGLPIFQWSDAFSFKNQAAKVETPQLELSSLIFNIGSLNSIQASRFAECGKTPVEAAKLYMQAAGVFKLIQDQYAEDAIFDFQKANLDAAQQYMMASASHCTYLSQAQVQPPPHSMLAKLARQNMAHYTAVAASLRILPGLSDYWLEAAQFYISYFRLLYFTHVAESLASNLKDPAAVDGKIGPAIRGLKTAELSQIPVPAVNRKAFEALRQQGLSRCQVLRGQLETENGKIYGDRIPKEVEEPKLEVFLKLEPKVPMIPEELDDALAALPSSAVTNEYKNYKVALERFVQSQSDEATHHVMDLRKKLNELQVMGLLARAPEGDGSALPPALLAKVTDIAAKHPQPAEYLATSLATMKGVAEACKADVAEAEKKYNDSVAADAVGFNEHGAKWRLGSCKFEDMPESKSYAEALSDFKERLQSAAKANTEMTEKIQIDLSLLGKTVAEHEEWVRQGGQGVVDGHGGGDLLSDLSQTVSAFEGKCAEVEGLSAGLTSCAESELKVLMPSIMATGDPKAFLHSKMDSHKEVAMQLKQARDDADALYDQLSQKTTAAQAHFAQQDSGAEDRRKAVATYINNLDDACTTFLALDTSLSQGERFYSQMTNSCSELKGKVGSLAGACDEQWRDLHDLLRLRNKRENILAEDRALAAQLNQQQRQAEEDRLRQMERDHQFALQQQQQQQQQLQQQQQPIAYTNIPHNPYTASAPPAPNQPPPPVAPSYSYYSSYYPLAK